MAKTQVILYTRPGCHLCQEAKQAIEAAGCADDYTLTEVNIEAGPILLDLYKDHIPVITIDGVEAFRHRVDSDRFREKIRNRPVGGKRGQNKSRAKSSS
ncbi:MAG TPA: glutaredoxin family protein [Pyrinomonadaceae bacterium]|jgi:glutaredoxin